MTEREPGTQPENVAREREERTAVSRVESSGCARYSALKCPGSHRGNAVVPRERPELSTEQCASSAYGLKTLRTGRFLLSGR